MGRRIRAGLALALWAAGAAWAAAPSLCTRLADEARRLPPDAWAQPEPLAQWLRPARAGAGHRPSPTERALVADRRWRERLGLTGDEAVGVSRLPGTPVYLVEHVAGTGNCQSLVLVQARPGRPVRALAPPFDLADQALCMTRSAVAARVVGRPALVVGGAPAPASPDREYRIAPWTARGWGASCSLALRLHATMAAGARFCRPGAGVCEAGQAVAQRLAQAYEADRAAQAPLDARPFAAGQAPDAAVLAALAAPPAGEGAAGDANLALPLFGADGHALDAMRAQFSNADPRRLPVFIDGRWWLAVVGRGGVGWREGDAVLVALFAPPGGPADAVASYQFITRPAGLREAVARDERR
ncbi:MAG: hypothetical protein QM788_16020 [Roseateles sp.]|uniref:hypothetical protein n=1 Tax=Roseateles sp. TaxID=1971397 RepID=UPI0039ECA77C